MRPWIRRSCLAAILVWTSGVMLQGQTAGKTSAPDSAPAPTPPKADTTTWRGLPAWRLTDGRTEAVIVPQLGGRTVSYGRVDGLNWMWTGEPGSERRSPPLYWGGDKTYLGPHSHWDLALGSMWPPPAPDYEPAEVVPPPAGALFSTLGHPWPGSGARVRRDYTFESSGDLVITHSIAAVPGNRETGAVWIVTQTIPSDAVFVPLAEPSPYQKGIFNFKTGQPDEELGATWLAPTLLQLQPKTGVGFKLGAHPAKPALAAIKATEVFLQRSDPQPGQYPEGAPGAGLSVEVYHHDQPPPLEYTELELLSPLRRLDQGATLVTRWSVHSLDPATTASPSSRQAAITALLHR